MTSVTVDGGRVVGINGGRDDVDARVDVVMGWSRGLVGGGTMLFVGGVWRDKGRRKGGVSVV